MTTRQRSSKGRPATPAPPLLNDVVGDGALHEPWPQVKMPHPPVRLADRKQRIATLAYERAESRGFAPGHELEDWLAAEREVDDQFEGRNQMT